MDEAMPQIESEQGLRANLVITIQNSLHSLLNNGDRWEENARKCWRREDAANNRWLQATRELAEAKAKLEATEWRAQLLADQRDVVLTWCKDREADGTVWIWDLYSILITDPKDGS